MTSAVITPETKDTPSLTVTVSKLSSSSPFPSPGSPFLPPPVPSAHEYALISPLSKRRSTDSRMNVGSKTDHESAASTHPVGATAVTATAETTPNPVTEPRPTRDKRRESTDITANGGNNNGLVAAFASALEPAKPDSKALANGQATTSTAKSSYSAGVEARLASSEPLPKGSPDATLNTLSTPDDDAGGTSASPSTPISSTPSTSAVTTATDDTAKPSLDSLKSARNSLHSSRDSLFSSRPAPLSPADSRRASTALSRHSSTRSRPGSAPSLTPSNTFNAEAASPTTPTPTQQQQQQQQLQLQQTEPTTSTPSALATSSILVKIRDFAFPDEDVRHTGTGPLTPRPNRRLQRPLSTWSASSASSAGSEDHDDRAAAGSSSYGFPGWGLGRLGWFGASALGGPGPAGGASNAPSQGDFARNFTDETSPEYEMDDPYESLDDDDDDDDDDGVGAHGGDNGERPLLPGLYRALYAFEPEGTAEMALEEDQMVRVIGRGGGVGWAIVARSGDEGHALVPEGYLEFVSLDRNQVGEEEG